MKQYVNNSPFNIPNLGMNVKVFELEYGIKLTYTLSCDKDFPRKTFTNKNKAYYVKEDIVIYQRYMSARLFESYLKLKNDMMLELNAFKIQKLQQKQHCLKQLKLF